MAGYDLEGQKFGRLTVLRFHSYTKTYQKRWLCECDCGGSAIVSSGALISGHTQSCGCLHKEFLVNRLTTHGGTHERLYTVWNNMKRRCSDPSDKKYHCYGGRGIKFCNEWNEYAKFREWALSNGYDENADFGKCTLDRIDVNGDYCPENCRWVSMLVQHDNRRNNVRVEWDGNEYTLGQLSSLCDIPRKTLYWRIVTYKWPVERAIKTPYEKKTSISI